MGETTVGFSHILMCVDEFRVTREGTSLYTEATLQEEIRLHGWFLAGSAVTSMQVVFTHLESESDQVLAIADFGSASEDLYEKYRADFGEAARRCRFHFARRLSECHGSVDFGRLRIVLEDGSRFERSLGAPTRDQLSRTFSDEERSLVGKFESMGENCELGLVQRRIGVDRMTLLRFTGVRDPLTLAQAIRERFVGFVDGDRIQAIIRDGEWMVQLSGARLDLHTGRTAEAMSEQAILDQERRRLTFLAERFIDDLEDAERIYVYRALPRPDDVREHAPATLGMDAVYDSLCEIAASPRLVWLNEADEAHPSGHIERIRGHLYRAWIARLTPLLDASKFDAEMWLGFLGKAIEVIGASATEEGTA